MHYPGTYIAGCYDRLVTEVAGRSVGSGGEAVTGIASERERARQRVQARRDFSSHVVAYIVINAFLVGTWALTGGGSFWPAWVLAAWGAGLALHAWDAFVRRPITDADVDTELRRQRH